jgi:hypothetical protein
MNPGNASPNARRQPLRRIAWQEINEPGAYVELATGALYRVPRESLLGGASPLVEKQGVEGAHPVRAGAQPSVDSQFVRVSGNPNIFSLGARMICVEYDIRPCF